MIVDGEILAPILHLAQILAGGKATPAAGENDAANGLVSVRLLKRLGCFSQHGVGKRIQRLGAVKGDGGNPLLHVIQNRFKAHLTLAFAVDGNVEIGC